MNNIVVIGVQFGDEGKGKIVDWLCAKADIGVRFQGGHNAGHTLVADGITYTLSCLPSAIVHAGRLALIGNGVVVDPWLLLKEIEQVRHLGIEVHPERLVIDDSVSLILPVHRHLDEARENSPYALGTTGRGIGPAYEDKAGRRAVRLGDLANPEQLKDMVERLLWHHNILARGVGLGLYQAEEVTASLLEVAPHILPYSGSVRQRLQQSPQARVIFEGAQGVMLDLDHGTYPFVTASNTVAAQAAIGTGIATEQLGSILGVCKAYTTRVGAGPFPTEQGEWLGDYLRTQGAEYGTVTGRPRRCGWFDAVLVRQAVQVSGLRYIALTKLDVLSGLEQVRIAVGYRCGEQTLDYFPSRSQLQSQLQPIYETLPGWQQPIYGLQSRQQLPKAALTYLARIEELVGAKIALLSTSPERRDMIVLDEMFMTL